MQNNIKTLIAELARLVYVEKTPVTESYRNYLLNKIKRDYPREFEQFNLQ